MSDQPVLTIDDVYKHYKVRGTGSMGFKKKAVKAVDGVSLELFPGEIVALVGESGCGKSSLAKVALKLAEPDRGSVKFEGDDIGAMKAKELRYRYRANVQAVFQDPAGSLNPRRNIEEIVSAPLLLHKKTTKDLAPAKVEELLEAQGLAPGSLFTKRKPSQLSGGQQQRVAIARALGVEPKVLIADEAVSALDVSVRAQVLERLLAAQVNAGVACLFISHDLGVVRAIADRVAIMYLGRIVEVGPVKEIMENPQHPYTRMLLDAVPRADPVAASEREPMDLGEPPNAAELPSGCRFAPRCPLAQDECVQVDPALESTGDNRSVACIVASRKLKKGDAI